MTAVAILLPDLLENNYTLPADFSESEAAKKLRLFNESLEQLDITAITNPDEVAFCSEGLIVLCTWTRGRSRGGVVLLKRSTASDVLHHWYADAIHPVLWIQKVWL